MRWPNSAPASATAKMSRLSATDWRLTTASTHSFCTCQRKAAACWRTWACSKALMPGLSHFASSCKAKRMARASVSCPASEVAGTSCVCGVLFFSQRSRSAWPRGNWPTAWLASCQLNGALPSRPDDGAADVAVCPWPRAGSLWVCAMAVGPMTVSKAASRVDAPCMRFKNSFIPIS